MSTRSLAFTVEKQSSDPAAGVEITYTATEDLVVHSLVFSLTTDATATTRQVTLAADDGTDVFFRTNRPFDHAQSLTHTYCGFVGNMYQSGSIQQFPLPTGGLRMRSGYRLRTITANLQAGDNFTAAVLQVERI